MELLETLVFSCAYYLLCSCIPGIFGNSASIDTSVMKEKFDLIATVLFQTDWNVFFTLTFEDVCHRFGADLREMDNLMYIKFTDQQCDPQCLFLIRWDGAAAKSLNMFFDRLLYKFNISWQS